MGRRKFGRDFIDPPFCLLYSSVTCFQGIQHGWVRVSCRGHTQMCLKPCFLTQLSAEKQVWSQHQVFPAPNFRWEYDQTPPPDGSPEPKAQPSGSVIQRGMKKQGKPCLSLASNSVLSTNRSLSELHLPIGGSTLIPFLSSFSLLSTHSTPPNLSPRASTWLLGWIHPPCFFCSAILPFPDSECQ